ncbi:MAG TPA: hypothetical protein VLJ78_06515 [Microvirga sp.]|jgi:hypothetical protein|nr:hypothetical protein [Microvirga sp.]
MADPDDPNATPPSAEERREPARTEGDVPNLGPTSDPSGRDFGDSAGYGGGGSTRDYQDVVGENPVTAGRPNPLDAIIPPEPPTGQDEEREDPDTSG